LRDEEQLAEEQALPPPPAITAASFDADGVCIMVQSGLTELPEGWFVVPPGTGPKDVWLRAGRVRKASPVNVTLPKNPVRPFTLQLAAGTVAEVLGKRYRGSVTIDPGRTVAIEFRGARQGTVYYFNAARRRQDAYPSIGEQLDALWETLEFPPGSLAAKLQAKIRAVKKDIPEPD